VYQSREPAFRFLTESPDLFAETPEGRAKGTAVLLQSKTAMRQTTERPLTRLNQQSNHFNPRSFRSRL
jgi:hypothetical protein